MADTVPLNYDTAVVGATVRWPNGHEEVILDFTPHGPTTTVTRGGRVIRERRSALLVLPSGAYCGLPANARVVAK